MVEWENEMGKKIKKKETGKKPQSHDGPFSLFFSPVFSPTVPLFHPFLFSFSTHTYGITTLYDTFDWFTAYKPYAHFS